MPTPDADDRADSIDLPDATMDRLHPLRERVQELQQQIQTYLQGVADVSGVDDLSRWRVDWDAGRLVPLDDEQS